MAKSFNSTIAPDKGTVMVVDALNLGFRWKHSGAVHFLDDYVRTVESLKKSYKAEKVIIACDEGSSSYRKSFYPEYKQTRKDKYEQQTDEEREAFELFFAEFNEVVKYYTKNENYAIFKFPKCEADDIAGYITLKRKALGIEHIWHMSSDKDWDLLVGPSASRFSYVTRKEVREDNWHEHYDIPIDNLIDVKCLTGDTGDNIPGVPGVGPKRAVELVKSYGSAYDIASSLPISSKYKYVTALNEFGAEGILRNFRLMDILSHCEEALGPENCAYIDQKLKEYL